MSDFESLDPTKCGLDLYYYPSARAILSTSSESRGWHYLEHPWWAEQNSYAFEPPGDVHTLEVPDDVEEIVAMFHVTGAYSYVDVDGNTVGVEDVFSKIQKAMEHYEKVGLGADFVIQFIP
ncbi:hypothetical protein TrVGV298_010883 [Trichoderma virens]|nr:hypothetical protein TrVGV298_010883 [Trichoderma virens]